MSACTGSLGRAAVWLAAVVQVVTLSSAQPAAAQCSPDAISGLTIAPGLAVCEGTWIGQIGDGGGSLCDTSAGYAVCNWQSQQIHELGVDDATGFPGCYAYNASQDFGQCQPCDGSKGNDDLAGIGAGCWDWTEFKGGTGGCLMTADSHRLDASCCHDFEEPETACTQDPVSDGCCGSPDPLPVDIIGVACCLQDCVLQVELRTRRVRPGDQLEVGVYVAHHKTRTARASILVWIEDESGSVIASRTTRRLTLRQGSIHEQQVILQIPGDAQAGEYVAMARIERMQQGVATAAAVFQVKD